MTVPSLRLSSVSFEARREQAANVPVLFILPPATFSQFSRFQLEEARCRFSTQSRKT